MLSSAQVLSFQPQRAVSPAVPISAPRAQACLASSFRWAQSPLRPSTLSPGAGHSWPVSLGNCSVRDRVWPPCRFLPVPDLQQETPVRVYLVLQDRCAGHACAIAGEQHLSSVGDCARVFLFLSFTACVWEPSALPPRCASSLRPLPPFALCSHFLLPLCPPGPCPTFPSPFRLLSPDPAPQWLQWS